MMTISRHRRQKELHAFLDKEMDQGLTNSLMLIRKCDVWYPNIQTTRLIHCSTYDDTI